MMNFIIASLAATIPGMAVAAAKIPYESYVPDVQLLRGANAAPALSPYAPSQIFAPESRPPAEGRFPGGPARYHEPRVARMR